MREKLHTKATRGKTGEMKRPLLLKAHTEPCQIPTATPPRRSELHPAPVQARIKTDIKPNASTSKDSRPGAHFIRERKSFLRILSTTVA
jgi:hypothetical protein